MSQLEFISSDRNGIGVYKGDKITLEHYQITHLAEKMGSDGMGRTKCGKIIWICKVVETNDFETKCKKCFPITKYPRGDLK